MKVLVTGGTGFIGRALLPRLIAAGYEVLATRRGEGPAPALDGVRWIQADLASPSLADALPHETCDAVVHLAQSLAYREFPAGATDMFAVNCAATMTLLDWAQARSVRRFVLASTGSIYGRSARPFREDDPTPATDFYSCSKKAAEQVALGFADLLDVLVIRIFGVYGPGQEGKLVPNLAARIRRGEAVTLAGQDGLCLSPLHIDDLNDGLLAALDLEGTHVLNLGANRSISLREIATAIGGALNEEVRFEIQGEGDPGQALVGDVTRIAKLTGWRPRIELAEGIARTFG